VERDFLVVLQRILAACRSSATAHPDLSSPRSGASPPPIPVPEPVTGRALDH
jgi:hypothetical protein